MALDCICPIITELVKDLIFNILRSVKRHVCYPFNYDANVDKLQTATQELENRRERVQEKVNEANRNNDRIYENVTNWLANLRDARAGANRLIHGEEQVKQKKSLVGFGPDLTARYHLSRNADKLASTLDNLKNEQELSSVAYALPPKQISAPSVFSREALQSRMSVLKDVMEALQDPKINMIGVYGMGGVGKTTLAKEVHRQAQEEKLFDVVIMVFVSQSTEIRRIQKEIAEVLGMNLDVEGILLRAGKLYERLSRKDEKVLIILDDVWKHLKLEDVGIPFGKEGKECKILLTSRRLEICRAMGANKTLAIDVLSDDEAWSLFQMTVADSRDLQLPLLASQLAKKCSGLPLLIIKVATDLRYKEADAWQDKVRQLSEFDNEDIDNKIHKVLESSYQNLPTNEIKSFFLLCGLIGQSNIRIQYLLEYAMGLGLFKRITTVANARIRIANLIDDLKGECLLLDGHMDGFVKMHDVVRDTAMSIASREQHAFFGISGFEVRDWPKEDCTRIFLPFCDIKELPGELDCPKAEILLLVTEDFALRIPDSFFNRTRQLKVVELSGMYFASLPSSLGFLANIHTLCLHRCQVDDITLIGELRQLEILSLADSHVVKLPRQIEQLSHLKLLDLTNCSKLKSIPANVISKLLMLEELYMNNSFTQWEHEGANNNGTGNISLAELEGLSALTTLEVKVTDPAALPKLMISNEFQNFRILVGDDWEWSHDPHRCSRTLQLKLKTSILSEPWIRVFLKNAELIQLQDVMGIRNFLYDLDIDGFPLLKDLQIAQDQETENFIKPKTIDSCPAFPVLESLKLLTFERLKKFYDCRIPPGSFSKLKKLSIEKCNRLTHLFTSSTVRCFSQLQDLKVLHCPEIEFIVICDSDDEVVEFTHLHWLRLVSLPKLKSFCQGKIHSSAEQYVSEDHSLPLFGAKVCFPNMDDLRLTHINCEKIWEDRLSKQWPNLTRLSLWNCMNLKYIFTSSFKSILQLKDLYVDNCKSIEEIIIPEEKSCGKEEVEEKIVFTQLNSMYLVILPRLRRFCRTGCSLEFQALKKLNIDNCGALMCFVGDTPIREAIAVYDHQSLFNEKVFLPNLEKLYLFHFSGINIWHSELATDSFSKLKTLYIDDSPTLVTLFPSSVLPRFLRLESLTVISCTSLQEIYRLHDLSHDIVFDLKDLNIRGLSSLRHIWSIGSVAVTFPNLQSVQVQGCNVERIFPASIARELVGLEQLKVHKCHALKEIIAEIEQVVEPQVISFKFPQLSTIMLKDLEELESLYPGKHASEFPKLKCVEVSSCPKVVKFGSESHGSQDIQVQSQLNNEVRGRPLLLVEKVPNLEELTLEENDLIMMESGKLPVEFFFRLKIVKLFNLESKGRNFFERTRSLNKLVVNSGSVEELVSHKVLIYVKHLGLHKLYRLKQIWKEDSLVQNLRSLEIRWCDQLRNLVTTSTAKTMVNLVSLSVHSCKKLTEIVANDGKDKGEIVFSKLKSLELKSLASLSSFYSGSQSLNFPVLVQMNVWRCSNMKVFSRGPLSTPKLRKVYRGYLDDFLWEGNLNDTIACS